MNKTGISYLDFCWNPMGAGCSNSPHCPTCWSRKLAQSPGPQQPKCPDCRAFKVHVHPERFERKLSPAHVKKPAVVGVNFQSDTFDAARPAYQIDDVMQLLAEVECHQYVLLTRQYERAKEWASAWWAYNARPGGWCWGTTCQDQDQFMRAASAFGDNHHRWWVSMEPLSGPITPMGYRPEGVIIGCDNTVIDKAPYWEKYRSTAKAFAEVGVKVFVKQLYTTRCGNCGAWAHEIEDDQLCCGEPTNTVLVKEPDQFPPDLRSRELPWTLTTK